MTRTPIICALAFLALLAASGCSLRSWLLGDLPTPPPAAAPVVPPLDPPAPPADPALEPAPESADTELDQLRRDAAGLKGQLAAKQAEIKAREAAVAAAKREAEQAPLRALCRWAAYIGAGATIAGVVLAGVVALASSWWPPLRLVPLGWKSGAILAAAGALAFGASQALAASLPWIGAASIIALVVVLVALLAWSALTWKRGGVAMASELRTYAGELPEVVRARLDEGSRDRQGRAATVGDHLLEVARGR
jgi:hypothetical protein